jgi:hypothetical protein
MRTGRTTAAPSIRAYEKVGFRRVYGEEGQRHEELLREAELSRQARVLRAARKRGAGRRLPLAWEIKRQAGRLLKHLRTLRKAG